MSPNDLRLIQNCPHKTALGSKTLRLDIFRSQVPCNAFLTKIVCLSACQEVGCKQMRKGWALERCRFSLINGLSDDQGVYFYEQ